jgi:hypothetical protein
LGEGLLFMVAKSVYKKVYKGVDKMNKIGYTSYTINENGIGGCYG